MFCSNCGKKIDDNAKFCDACGANVEKVNFGVGLEAPNPSAYIEDSTFQEMFLKPSGRLNRLRFFKRGLILGLINIALIIIIESIFSDQYGIPNSTADLLTKIVGVAFLVPSYFLDVRRLQDMNKNNQLAIVNVAIGFIGVIANTNDPFDVSPIVVIAGIVAVGIILYLLFTDGTHGTNAYGPDPLNR